jgi:trigger factor
VEVNLVSLSDVSKEVEIHATSDELKPHFEKAYHEYRPKIEIKGFRKGKAPLDMIKKLYGELIENEYLDKLASELYRQAVQEKDLKPIGDPTLVDLDYRRGEHFRFKIKYDVRPTIILKKYKGLSVKAAVHRFGDGELEEEIDRVRKRNSALVDAEQATDDEYIVTAEMQELDESGVPLIGKKTENARFYLADPQLEKPFKDALTGAAKGNEHTVRFEHQHGDHTHKVNAKLNVTNVQKVILPELNDELVKKVTKEKIATVDEFRKSLREDLESYWNEKNRRSRINAIIAEIIRLHEFEVPESLIRSVIEGLLEEIKNQYPNKQLPQDFEFEKFFQENREYALYQSRWALLREEIVGAENLEADEATLVTLAEREAPKIGIDKERLITYYKSSDQVKDRLVSDKLMDLLISSSTIEEVDDATVQDSLLKG